MLVTSLSLIGGLILLAIGAEGLVRGSTGIAFRLGISALVIGLTVVALGTGSPELFVSVEAALAGNSGIALGNVIGSNISNIGLILGVSALVRPLQVRSELIRREMPLLIGVTLLLCFLLYDGNLSRIDGFVLTAGSVAYTVAAYVLAKRNGSDAIAAEFDEELKEPHRPVWLDVLMVVLGLIGLLIGAKLLLSGAVAVAERFGVSQAVIGLTIVAIGTSLPELATSVVAAVKGESDIAFGNVIGSNILNILCILGVAALIRPFEVHGLRPLDIGMFIGSAVLVLPLMRRGFVLNRWEGALLVGAYVAYIMTLIS